MSKRSDFIDYVKNGGDKIICSPQIMAGVGFVEQVLGIDRHNTTTEDVIKVCEMFDILPLYNFGIDLTPCNPDKLTGKLVYNHPSPDGGGEAKVKIETPYGDLTTVIVDKPEHGTLRTKMPVESEKDFDAFEWFLDQELAGDYDPIIEQIAKVVDTIGDRGAIDFQFGLQPYELFSMTDTHVNVMLAYDFEDRFKELMDKVLEVNKLILKAVAMGGGDFVFLGGPGVEMVSPYIYEEFMIPWGKKATDYAHDLGLLIYSHVCSPLEPFLTNGYFNRLGIDLFETLTPPPLGNVKSIEDAFSKIDKNICTRGNIGLDKLMYSTPDVIEQEVLHLLEMTKLHKRKHIIAASDYLMSQTKIENFKMMVDTVTQWNKQNSKK